MPLQARVINARRDTIVTRRPRHHLRPACVDGDSSESPLSATFPTKCDAAQQLGCTTVTGTSQPAAEAFDAVVTDDMLVEMSVAYRTCVSLISEIAEWVGNALGGAPRSPIQANSDGRPSDAVSAPRGGRSEDRGA